MAIDDYDDREEREIESVRCAMRRERTRKWVNVVWKNEILTTWVKWLVVWVSIHIKEVIGYEYGFDPRFEIVKKKLIPKQDPNEENPLNRIWFERVAVILGLLSCLAINDMLL